METGRHHTILEEHVKRLGIGEEASAWLRKALHPPSFIEKVAIPDESFRPGVRLDFKPSVTISAPAGIGTGTWDLCILSIPGDSTAAIWCAAPAGTDFGGATATGSSEIGVLSLQDVTPLPGYYSSISWGAIADGTISDNECAFQVPASQPAAFRTTYRSLTTELVASSLYNGGTIIAGQVDNDWTRQNPSFLGFLHPVSGPIALCVPSETTIPLSNESLALSCPGAMVGPAREGCYIPQRLIGPSQPFVTPPYAQGRLQMNTGGFNTLFPYVVQGSTEFWNPPCIPTWPNVRSQEDALGNSGNGPAWWISALYAGGSLAGYNALADSGFDRCATGVVIYRGLDANAAVLLRAFVGLEVVTMPSSPFKTFMQPPASPDLKAMHAYYMLANNMNIAYPAKYNQLGLLIPALVSAIGTVGPMLMPAVKHIVEAAGKKVASMIAPKQATVPRPVPLQAMAVTKKQVLKKKK